jgi:NADH-quinone oxidoreductase subunit C
MSGSKLLDQLQAKFKDGITGSKLDAIDPWIEVAPNRLNEVAAYVRDDVNLKFDFLNCISVVDYFEPDAKKAAKVDWKPHLEVIYHLSSISKKHQLVLKVILPRWKDDVAGELPEVQSVADIWRTADWHERECYDLGGVNFVGHPNLKRILCPDDWEGYPLRKDYVMPLEYHGIRGR